MHKHRTPPLGPAFSRYAKATGSSVSKVMRKTPPGSMDDLIVHRISEAKSLGRPLELWISLDRFTLHFKNFTATSRLGSFYGGYDQFPHWSIGWYRWYRCHGPWLEAFITYILGGVLALVIFAIPFLTSLKQSQTRVASWRQKKRPRAPGRARTGAEILKEKFIRSWRFP